jgi:hypothetical protein
MNSLKATIIGTLLILPFPFIEAARPVPFTVDEMMSLLEIKGWKYERLYREPVKGITLSIVVGSPAPGGGIIERQMPQPFGYHPPSGQTRYVVGLVLLESKRQFRLMIDDIAMEVDRRGVTYSRIQCQKPSQGLEVKIRHGQLLRSQNHPDQVTGRTRGLTSTPWIPDNC